MSRRFGAVDPEVVVRARRASEQSTTELRRRLSSIEVDANVQPSAAGQRAIDQLISGVAEANLHGQLMSLSPGYGIQRQRVDIPLTAEQVEYQRQAADLLRESEAFIEIAHFIRNASMAKTGLTMLELFERVRDADVPAREVVAVLCTNLEGRQTAIDPHFWTAAMLVDYLSGTVPAEWLIAQRGGELGLIDEVT